MKPLLNEHLSDKTRVMRSGAHFSCQTVCQNISLKTKFSSFISRIAYDNVIYGKLLRKRELKELRNDK